MQFFYFVKGIKVSLKRVTLLAIKSNNLALLSRYLHYDE